MFIYIREMGSVLTGRDGSDGSFEEGDTSSQKAQPEISQVVSGGSMASHEDGPTAIPGIPWHSLDPGPSLGPSLGPPKVTWEATRITWTSTTPSSAAPGGILADPELCHDMP